MPLIIYYNMVSSKVCNGGWIVEHIYIQLAETLEERIQNGFYISGKKLPSERKLAEEFGVSRMTARQSVKKLEEKGLVHKEKGRGTYIEAPSFAQNNVKSFTETVEDMGFEVSSKLLELSTVHSSAFLAKQLEVSESSEFLKMKRLRLGNNIPLALETIYIPKDLVADIKAEELDGSLYELLESRFNYQVKHVSYKIEATIANPVYEKMMELNKKTALLKVTGITYVNNEQKLLYEESYYRSDLYSYQVDILRKF